MGQYEQAREYYQQSLAITREIGDRNGEANSYIGLGNAYYFLGQYEQAREYYQQSLAIFKEIGDKPGEAKALFNVDLCFKKVQ
ncbi:tetratricopeptide repeat protein [Crocosphaera watsonii]|uniref:tetratricopeptide repeat protein n=1 Tax=Crocosphaera watsonii TaxID=263511 RepID=UPI001EF9E226|nr:tetratricopeptide repeat protein [Crocosphaera watsonii]